MEAFLQGVVVRASGELPEEWASSGSDLFEGVVIAWAVKASKPTECAHIRSRHAQEKGTNSDTQCTVPHKAPGAGTRCNSLLSPLSFPLCLSPSLPFGGKRAAKVAPARAVKGGLQVSTSWQRQFPCEGSPRSQDDPAGEEGILAESLQGTEGEDDLGEPGGLMQMVCGSRRETGDGGWQSGDGP